MKMMNSFGYYLRKTFHMLAVICEILLAIIAIAVLVLVIDLSKKHPSNDRDWSPDQKILPVAEFQDNGKILIRNVRNAVYKTTTDYMVGYYDREYDPDKLKKVWFVLVPFTGYAGAAHGFVSFEFEDGAFVSVSVEIRKENGEKYSAVKGMLREFELMYVIANERDVIKLRVFHHKDKVYMYPVKTTKENAEELFRDMLMRSNGIGAMPEFYNTFSNSCVTNIVYHINKISPGRISFFDYRIFAPENADKYAYDLGLIDTKLPFSAVREKYLINPLVLKYADDPEFSRKIRGQ